MDGGRSMAESLNHFKLSLSSARCLLILLKIKSQKVNNNLIVIWNFFVPQEQANCTSFLLCLCLLSSDSEATVVFLTTFNQNAGCLLALVTLLIGRKALNLIWHCNQVMHMFWQTRASTSWSLQESRTSLPDWSSAQNCQFIIIWKCAFLPERFQVSKRWFDVYSTTILTRISSQHSCKKVLTCPSLEQL